MTNTCALTETSDITPVDLSVVDKPVTLFKTLRGFNIDITAVARAARENIDAVRVISVPSIVRIQRRRGEECETPTLSELGGGVDYDFCQIISGADGRPVSIDNVVFINSDPAKAGINHATAAVEVGSFFALGWKRLNDGVVLIYRIMTIEEYMVSEKELQARAGIEQRPVAKLTCQLEGHSFFSWKGHEGDIPDYLSALFATTQKRMTTDYHAPLYMEYVRMLPTTDESRALAELMKHDRFGTVEYCTPDTFMSKITNEILDIRRVQYMNLAADSDNRKVAPLRGVELLELDRDNNSVILSVGFPRPDTSTPILFRVTLTEDNYTDEDGRVSVERGLVLRATTFERLFAMLNERNKEPVVAVSIQSIR